jgi:hypothetical protein
VRFSTFALTCGAALCLALPVLADDCSTIPGNLIENCAFQDGTYTATIPYLPNPPNSDPGVPNFWSADPGFIEGYIVSGADTVVTDPVTGTDYLSIGTGPLFPPLAMLSQSLADVSGVTYDGSISGDVGGGYSFDALNVLIDGLAVSLDSAGSFSFTGTGVDELSLAATGGPFDISDVVVTAAGVSEVPEPRTTFLIPFTLLACLVWLSTRRRMTRNSTTSPILRNGCGVTALVLRSELSGSRAPASANRQ